MTGLAKTTVTGLALPTVMGLVRALEAALGEKLFTRTGRSVVMTEVGGWWRPGSRAPGGEAGGGPVEVLRE